jgi:hypothetical protein
MSTKPALGRDVAPLGLAGSHGWVDLIGVSVSGHTWVKVAVGMARGRGREEGKMWAKGLHPPNKHRLGNLESPDVVTARMVFGVGVVVHWALTLRCSQLVGGDGVGHWRWRQGAPDGALARASSSPGLMPCSSL